MGTDKLLASLKSAKEKEKEQKQNGNKKFQKVSRLVTRDPGNYIVRFLPNKTDHDSLPYELVFLHFGFIHPNYKQAGTFRCLGRDCPLCREAKKMEKAKDPNAWRFKSTPVYLYYIVDSSENFKFLRLSRTAHEQVLGEIESKAKSKTNVLSLENGRVAKLSLEKSEGKNKWRCDFITESNTVSPELQDSLHNAPELDTLYRVYSAEELEKIVKGEKLVFTNNQKKSEGTGQEPSENSTTVIKIGSSELSEVKGQVKVIPLVKENVPVEPTTPVVNEDLEARKQRIRLELELIKK